MRQSLLYSAVSLISRSWSMAKFMYE